MPGKQVLLPFVVLLLLLRPVTATAQSRDKNLPSTQIFGLLKELFSFTPLPPPKVLDDLLRQHNLERVSETDTYALYDPQGRLEITPYLPTHIYLRFFPVASSPIAAPVLGALISKSTALYLEGGNTIRLALPGRDLGSTVRQGRLSEGITFTLPEGFLVETTAHIEWSEPK